MFFNPDSEINLNMARLLMLVVGSRQNNEEFALNIDRLVTYDFLSRNPIVLARLLIQLGKAVKINVKDYESGSLTETYINRSSLYDYHNTKAILQILHNYKILILSRLDSQEVSIKASELGVTLFSDLNSEYLVRFKEIALTLKSLNSISPSSLRRHINFIING